VLRASPSRCARLGERAPKEPMSTMKHLADWILDQASLLVPCLFAGAFVALIGGEVYDRIREQP